MPPSFSEEKRAIQLGLLHDTNLRLPFSVQLCTRKAGNQSLGANGMMQATAHRRNLRPKGVALDKQRTAALFCDGPAGLPIQGNDVIVHGDLIL
jgi:hypothetical protein